MLIHLKRGERVYINGAVLRVDRRASLEVLNNVDFLLENHVIQAEDATTPFRQLYFVVQTMLIDPDTAGVTQELYKHLSHRMEQNLSSDTLRDALALSGEKVLKGRYFDALKALRTAFPGEDALLGRNAFHSGEAA